MPNEKFSAVLFLVGGTNDGPGFYIGADGKIHRIPPWSPETLAEVTTALTVINQASHIKDAGVRQRFEAVAEEVIKNHTPEIMKSLAQAGMTRV